MVGRLWRKQLGLGCGAPECFGREQDEFLHCTDPGSDQERINVTFRWIKQHASTCPLLGAGVACCLPTCARGSSVPGTELVEKSGFWAFWLLLGALCILGVLALLVMPLVCVQGLGFKDVPPAGPAPGAEVCGGTITLPVCKGFCDFTGITLYMLALVERPRLHSYCACMFFWVRRHAGEIAGKSMVRPLFLLIRFSFGV